MAKQTIDIATQYPGWTGDPNPTAFAKVNANFDELYELTGSIGTIVEDVEQLKTEIEEKVDAALQDVDEKVAEAEHQLDQAVATIPALVDTAIAGRIPGKNRLINGNFDFSQRGVTGSRTSAAVEAFYTVDRWVCGFVNVNGNWGVGGTPLGEIPGSSRFLGYNIASIPNNQSSAYVAQKIEGVDTLAGKTITFSVWARSNVAGKRLAMRALQLFGAGGSPSPETSTECPNVVTLTTSFQRYSFTVTLPSVLGKTRGTSGNDGLLVVLDYCAPAPLYGGALSGQIGLFEVAQAQVEEGGLATGFDFRPLALELSLCQRYYCTSFPVNTTPATGQAGGEWQNATAWNVNFVRTPLVKYPVPMRAPPSLILMTSLEANVQGVGRIALFNGAVWNSTGTYSIYHNSAKGFVVDAQYGGFNAQTSYLTVFNWTADAEI
ncbi:MAG: hypothetical protein ACK4FW_01455 [Stenotrophomonas sp.]